MCTASVHGSAPIITNTAETRDALDAPVRAAAQVRVLEPPVAVDGADLGPGDDLDVRARLDARDAGSATSSRRGRRPG